MPVDEPRPKAGTGTVVDSDRLLPDLAPVAPETRVQEDGPSQPVCVSPESIQRYELKEEIGRGGMGSVYYARDTRLKRDVAVKVLLGRYAAAGAAAVRFVEEALITGQLQHPGVPPVHDLGTLPDGRPFIAMKLIRGKTLAAILTAPDRPDPSRLIAIFERICQTVAYAHAKHVIHRDLKPGNVMVGQFDEVQVMDWGLAKVVGPEAGVTRETKDAAIGSATDSKLIQSERTPETQTQAGAAMGTPAFMPPEQARGEVDRIGPRADVFCLGGILCEMLTGKPPYAGSAAEVRARSALGQLDDAYARLDECGTDHDVITLAKACLSADPASRPADAGAVAAAVVAYRDGLDARLRRAEVDKAKAETQATESRKRARLRLVLAGLGLVTVAVATVYNFRLGRANEDKRVANEAAQANNELTEEAIDQFVADLKENEKLKKYDDLRDVRRKLLETAVEFNKKLLERGGDEPRLKYKRADVHLTLGLLYAELEDLKQSEAEYRTAKELFGALHAADLDDDRALAGLASAANRLGNTLERGDSMAAAAAEYDEAISFRRTLVDRNRADDHKIDLATSLSNLAGLCFNRSQVAANRPDAATMFREGAALLRPIATGTAPALRAEQQYARLQANFAILLFARNDPSCSAASVTAREAFERAVSRYPDRDELRYEYVLFANKVGLTLFEADHFEQAETWLALAATECGTVVAAHPGVVSYRIQYADTLLNRAVTAFQVPDRLRDIAIPFFQTALDQVHRNVRDRPGVRDFKDQGLETCDRYATALTALGRHGDAIAVWDEAATYSSAERARAVGLRRELSRARAGDAATAVAAARRLAEKPFTTAEEQGFCAAVFTTAAAATKNGTLVFSADEVDRLTRDAKTLLDKAKSLPDFPRVRLELADVPALRPLLAPMGPAAR
jgi:serine/threonine protein kinase